MPLERLLDAFDSVAAGQRSRARLRTPHGWVRLEAMQPGIRARGPRTVLYALWNARRRHFRCARSAPGGVPLHSVHHSGVHQLLLMPV